MKSARFWASRDKGSTEVRAWYHKPILRNGEFTDGVDIEYTELLDSLDIYIKEEQTAEFELKLVEKERITLWDMSKQVVKFLMLTVSVLIVVAMFVNLTAIYTAIMVSVCLIAALFLFIFAIGV